MAELQVNSLHAWTISLLYNFTNLRASKDTIFFFFFFRGLIPSRLERTPRPPKIALTYDAASEGNHLRIRPDFESTDTAGPCIWSILSRLPNAPDPSFCWSCCFWASVPSLCILLLVSDAFAIKKFKTIRAIEFLEKKEENIYALFNEWNCISILVSLLNEYSCIFIYIYIIYVSWCKAMHIRDI